LFDLIRLSRHFNINLIGISQRPADIPFNILSQTDYILTFQQSLERDLKILSGYGFNPAEIQGLNNFKYLIKKI
jgi:DNA helicase HerA-like ATPase